MKNEIMLGLDKINVKSTEYEEYGHIQRMENELKKDEESNLKDENEEYDHIQRMKNEF